MNQDAYVKIRQSSSGSPIGAATSAEQAISWEHAMRAKRMFAAVVLAALDDAIKEERTRGTGVDYIRRWANSRDGREVLSCAGIDPTDRTVQGLVDYVSKGVPTTIALTQVEAEKSRA